MTRSEIDSLKKTWHYVIPDILLYTSGIVVCVMGYPAGLIVLAMSILAILDSIDSYYWWVELHNQCWYYD